MTDKIGSPVWCNYLSTRVGNALFHAFRIDRSMAGYNKLHNHVEIDFDSHTDETIRPLFKDLLERGLIYPKRIRNMGKKGRLEFLKWCGVAND